MKTRTTTPSRLTTLAFAALLGAVATEPAQGILFLEPISNAGQGFVASGGVTAGYDFTLTSTTSVAALGLWDLSSDGLASSHQVGLWNSAGTLLTSTTVSNASVVVPSTFNDGRWMFENLITPINLNAGQYYLGFLQPATGQDLVIQGNVAVNVAGASKGVGRFGGFNNPNNLVFPTSPSNGNGFFGPNFSTTAVPEPGSALLLAGGGLGLLLRRRRC